MAYITDGIDDEVARLLQNGGAGLLPTDTIYGLSCRALDEAAVEKLHHLKGRDENKPFIILISNVKMLDLLSISDEYNNAVAKYWPGALSVILPAENSPRWLHRGRNSLAVRLPDAPGLTSLINKTGPLISTSANLQGQPPVGSAEEAEELFGGKLDFYVHSGKLENPPSTLVVAENGKLKVVRQGSVKI